MAVIEDRNQLRRASLKRDGDGRREVIDQPGCVLIGGAASHSEPVCDAIGEGGVELCRDRGSHPRAKVELRVEAFADARQVAVDNGDERFQDDVDEWVLAEELSRRRSRMSRARSRSVTSQAGV